MSHLRLSFYTVLAIAITQPVLAQMPQGMQGGGMQGGGMQGRMPGPPPEASQACLGKSQNDACSFTTPRGSMTGTCGSSPMQKQLLCMPQGGPPGMSQGGISQGSRPQSGPQMGGRGPQGGGAQGGRHGADIVARDPGAKTVTSKVPDTQQGSCFDSRSLVTCPREGDPLYGQDANYAGPAASYTDNGDGSVQDNVTGLVWQKAHNAKRLGFGDAQNACANLTLGGQSDWRLPSIKELFSLSDFRGSQSRRFFIDDVFDLKEPGAEILQGDRFAASHSTGMMGQTWSSTIYTGVHYGRPGVKAAFFYNFLDGHIKQAPTGGRNTLFYRCVRGPEWGDNAFVDNGDTTVTDTALGLTWQKSDDGQSRDWPSALKYCEDLTLAGQSDWRLPNVKELQSIVDYAKNDPALDQRFLTQSDKKGWFWSSTTHGDNITMASYVCFGKCVSKSGIDTHGAGAQRSDPKTGNAQNWTSLGGQEDEVRINNLVRCVR